jgi:aminomethyltransferase
MSERVSALYGEHVALGADMSAYYWAGMYMPWAYARPVTEQLEAVDSVAGMIDMSRLNLVFVGGGGALRTLEWVYAQPIATIPRGRGRYVTALSATGKIADDAIVFHLADQQYLVVHGAGRSGSSLRAAAHATRANVTKWDAAHVIALHGPCVDAILEAAFGPAFGGLDAPFAILRMELSGADVWVARAGFSRRRRAEIYVDGSAACAVWGKLQELGAAPIDYYCLEIVRIRDRLPAFPFDIRPSNTLDDVGLGTSIARKASDFCGRNALSVAGRGQSKLAYVEFSAPSGAASSGSALVHRGRDIGILTSSVASPGKDSAAGFCQGDFTDGIGDLEIRHGASGTLLPVTALVRL